MVSQPLRLSYCVRQTDHDRMLQSDLSSTTQYSPPEAGTLWQVGGHDPRRGGEDPHDEDRGRGPVDRQQVQQHGGDPAHLGHQGTQSDRLVPGAGWEEFSGVEVHDSEGGRGSKLAQQREEQLENGDGVVVVVGQEEGADDTGEARDDLNVEFSDKK